MSPSEPTPSPIDPEDGASHRREALESLRLPDSVRGPRDPRARRRRRWLMLALLLGLGAVAWLWRTATAEPMAVQTATARAWAEVADEPVEVLSGSGYLVPAQPTIAIGSRVAGRIERYRVEEGDRVERGDPLVELERRPFEATAEQVAGALASARARLRLAQADRARTRALFDEGVASREELDRRESEAEVAQAAVEELEANLRRVRIDLEDTVIRAPTDGVVLETFKQPGEVAVPGGFSGSGDLLRLANLAEIRAELDVNESDLQRVALGQAARVVPDAFPDARYAGRVVRLSPQIDRQKGTREVEVRVLDPDERLLPDMSVRVDFLDALPAPTRPDDAVVIPRAALQRDAGGAAYVWVVEDGRARRRDVDVAETLGDRVVVASGLPVGTRLVVGAEPAEDGARVTSDPS